MINPIPLHPGYVKVKARENYGVKFYRPAYSGYGRAYYAKQVFKTAAAAQLYADRLLVRWIRLYDAALRARIEQPS